MRKSVPVEQLCHQNRWAFTGTPQRMVVHMLQLGRGPSRAAEAALEVADGMLGATLMMVMMMVTNANCKDPDPGASKAAA